VKRPGQEQTTQVPLRRKKPIQKGVLWGVNEKKPEGRGDAIWFFGKYGTEERHSILNHDWDRRQFRQGLGHTRRGEGKKKKEEKTEEVSAGRKCLPSS